MSSWLNIDTNICIFYIHRFEHISQSISPECLLENKSWSYSCSFYIFFLWPLGWWSFTQLNAWKKHILSFHRRAFILEERYFIWDGTLLETAEREASENPSPESWYRGNEMTDRDLTPILFSKTSCAIFSECQNHSEREEKMAREFCDQLM